LIGVYIPPPSCSHSYILDSDHALVLLAVSKFYPWFHSYPPDLCITTTAPYQTMPPHHIEVPSPLQTSRSSRMYIRPPPIYSIHSLISPPSSSAPSPTLPHPTPLAYKRELTFVHPNTLHAPPSTPHNPFHSPPLFSAPSAAA